MAAKESKEGGRAGGEYLFTSTVRERSRTRRPNRTMTRIRQKTNGGKE